jgi:peptidyl-tRNA hydrolase, PTH1 family
LKYLIVGLGNIGAKYENTRHNIGFKILDAFAKASNICFETSRYADVAELKFKGRTLVLVKPSTYMNLSGKAVNYWMQQHSISIENILILVDDIALPFGKVRIRAKGSDGGHNGLKDINERLNSQSYARLRFGIGNEYNKGTQIDYVLGEWCDEENQLLPERIDICIQAIKSFSTIGLARTMTDFNNK